MFETLSEWATALVGAGGGLALSLVLLVETVFPPIPSEAVLPFAGYLVHTGELSWFGALGGSTLGSLVGAYVLYGLGRVGGRPLIERHHRLLRFSRADLDRADVWFARHGGWVVLVCRMVPLLRSVVSVPAGVAHMPLLRFTALTAIGSLGWNALLIGAGYALGARWEQVGAVVDRASTPLLALVAVACIAIVAWWWRRNRRLGRARDRQDP